MEALMSRSAQTSERSGFARLFAHWWRSWSGRRRAMADLDGCGPAEMEHIARDVGVSAADLSILAGKWPDAADQLMVAATLAVATLEAPPAAEASKPTAAAGRPPA